MPEPVPMALQGCLSGGEALAEAMFQRRNDEGVDAEGLRVVSAGEVALCCCSLCLEMQW